MLFKFAYVVVAILAGTICYFIAKKRGVPHPSLWFVGGVLFHVFAVGAVMLVAKLLKSKKNGGFT